VAGGVAIQPMEQFELHHVLGAFGASVNFTQANLLMAVGAGLMLSLLHYGARPAAVIPGRLQALAEMLYSFVHDMAVDQIGEEGKRYFPFVFTLFSFVLMGNLIGLVPFSFAYTSHIAVTGALAALVITTVTIVGLKQHGLHFFSYFLPGGVPLALAPLIIPIEVISYLSRPVSLSVRLFANMMAGHVMMVVFATFVVMLGSAGGILAVGSVFPVVLNVALFLFELMVAGLQAYVFAILTCIYLHDAVHLH
jgi:F-type H+-transporting ATPase subunit a